jgi:Peptidoglycan-binding protein, CsiV
MSGMNLRTARFRTLCLSVLVALACGLPAVSQESGSPAYNIELIVFRATSALGGAENWGAEAGAASIAGDEETPSGSSQVGHFVAAIPNTAFQLSEIESKLRASGAYVPIAHVAWSQTASAWGTRAGFPLQRLGADVPGLTGTVFLERGQYLHLGMTLYYADPSPPGGLGAAPGTTFTINQSRRIRFYERNYYDHPAFGVIALVSPAQGARPPGR